MKPALLHFDVSTGLKKVLGSELITDDEVAVFELVKNSFDADARHVDLFFSDRSIVISDNGIGMTFDDIKNKWLLVAYSSKRNTIKSDDFRNEIVERKHYAGSKGVGRKLVDKDGNELTGEQVKELRLAILEQQEAFEVLVAALKESDLNAGSATSV